MELVLVVHLVLVEQATLVLVVPVLLLVVVYNNYNSRSFGRFCIIIYLLFCNLLYLIYI